MKYNVKISDKEKQILANLIGKRIVSIQDLSGGALHSSYCARLNFIDTVIDFTPDEVSTPENSKPLADVTRPLITDDHSQLRRDLEWTTTKRDIGIIKQIKIMQTLVTFSPLLSTTDSKVAAVVYGTGEGWYNILHHPNKTEIKDSQERAVVSLDIGVVIFTDKDLMITIMTDSLSYFVNYEISDKLPIDLESNVELVSIV